MRWRPQLYLEQGRRRGIPDQTLRNAVATASLAVDRDLPPILTLRHLSELVGVEYSFLRGVVGRRLKEDYTVFRVRKRPRTKGKREYRIICVPCELLMKTQRWIADNVLRQRKTHPASFAYSPKSCIVDACQVHCGAKWLIKLDIRRFFESISEIMTYRTFRNIGYQPLIAFELARISTRIEHEKNAVIDRWNAHNSRYSNIQAYRSRVLGHLPQGAPTSPMLSNLVAVDLDVAVAAIANRYELRHTRYADDICLSSTEKTFGRGRAIEVMVLVFRAMAQLGYSPNKTKTQIVPPGARKVVLGLGVDTDRPRLTRTFRDRLRQHFYYLTQPSIGPARHAFNRGFSSVIGLRHHIHGLVAFAHAVDPSYARQYFRLYEEIAWPL